MHDHGRPRFARLLAPLALIAFVVVVVVIVLGSDVVGGDDGGSTSSTSDLPSATDRTTTVERQQKPKKIYIIKANDTLSGIAAATGTTVDQLQELNPELDPQGLVAGQKIKLRE